MHQITNQELARIRYAEVLRNATRHHAIVREEPKVVDERPRPRVRPFAFLRPAIRLG